MSATDEIRKALSDPKPFYALAGAGDLAAEKLRDAPTLLTEVAGTVTTLATKIAAEAPERIAKVQAKLADVPSGLDPRGAVSTFDPRAAAGSIREAVGGVDTQALRDKVQTIALVQVGRVLEAAGKAVETYDGLAERGKSVVERYRGSGSGSAPSDVTVVVEQVVVDDAETETPAAPVVEDAVVEEPAPTPRRSQAKKTASTPRKRTTAPKSTKA